MTKTARNSLKKLCAPLFIICTVNSTIYPYSINSSKDKTHQKPLLWKTPQEEPQRRDHSQRMDRPTQSQRTDYTDKLSEQYIVEYMKNVDPGGRYLLSTMVTWRRTG